MIRRIFATFGDAKRWASEQRCGTLRRIEGTEFFEWHSPVGWSTDDEVPMSGAIDPEDPYDFPSWTWDGQLEIRCEPIFLDLLARCRNVSNDPHEVLTREHRTLAWCDNDTGLVWDAALIFQDPHGTHAKFQHDYMNAIGYAGFNDWRAPSLEELRTLLVAGPAPTERIKAPLAGYRQRASWSNRFEGRDREAFYLDFTTGEASRQRFIERERPSSSDYVMRHCASRCVRG